MPHKEIELGVLPVCVVCSGFFYPFIFSLLTFVSFGLEATGDGNAGFLFPALLCVSLYHTHFLSLRDVGCIPTPISQMRKPGHREVKWIMQDPEVVSDTPRLLTEVV